MVLDWFGAKRDVDELIARRKYAKAIELLQRQVDEGNRDPRVRLQLADVLTMENRGLEAVPILLGLADEHAADGQAAKAIALLKKIERLDPGRRDVDVKLAGLIKDKRGRRPAGGPPEGDRVGFEPSGAVYSAEHFEASPPAVSDEARIAAARGATWVPSTRAEDSEAAVPEVPPPSAPGAPVMDSPLFSGFDRDELVAVIRGLRLLSYEPGDLILAEGDAGDSLFVLTTGEVKAFVKDPETRRHVLVRRLGEGEFFGEISILSGKPRTATVTAAAHCELLELDRATLDGITQTYPNVRQVLEDFYIARATTQEEALRRQR